MHSPNTEPLREAKTINKLLLRFRTTYSISVKAIARFILLLMVTIHSSFAFCQSISPVACESLNKDIITIPNDTKGKFTLICVASSTKAQQELEGWLDPLYQKFIAKSGLMDDAFDVNLYFIPVITGTKVFADKVKARFNENTQLDIRPHILFVTGDNKEALNSLSIPQDNQPHFILFDATGKIVYRTNGAFTDEKLDAIDDLISG